MGKGSKPRAVNKTQYDSNFDEISWVKDIKDDAPLTNTVVKSKIGKAKRFIYK
jgi:hypothetical protein